MQQTSSSCGTAATSPPLTVELPMKHNALLNRVWPLPDGRVGVEFYVDTKDSRQMVVESDVLTSPTRFAKAALRVCRVLTDYIGRGAAWRFRDDVVFAMQRGREVAR